MDKLRKSSYLISVKLENEDKYMFVHGYTGAIDIVNKSIADYLASKTSFNDIDIPFTKETLDTLIERGYITAKSKSEGFDYTKRFAALLHKNSMFCGSGKSAVRLAQI